METGIYQDYLGVIRFYDGTIIAIEDQEYSADGLTNWEKTFNPNDHISTLDGVTNLGGHKYKRVKHSGDTSFQLPYRITPQTPEFQVTETELQWRFEDELTWNTLLSLVELQGETGETGEQGIPGEGWMLDRVGYFINRGDCCASGVTNNCNSCNPLSSGTMSYQTFLSLGDGRIALTSAIILAGSIVVDTITYTHYSDDGITWNAISSAAQDHEAQYLATSVAGAGAIDLHNTDYYVTRGKVYVCADNRWTELTNVATPSYMLKESAASTHIGFMDSYISAAGLAFDDTIGLINNHLGIIEQSITEDLLAQTIVGDGLIIDTPGDKPRVDVTEFAGFGLASYISTGDGSVDLQVLVSDIIGNGMAADSQASADGEVRELARVNINELIDTLVPAEYTGLATSTTLGIVETDGYDNLYVNTGWGLARAANGVNVIADELTILADTLTAITLAETDSATLGVQAKHIHANVVDALFGLEKDGTTTGSLRARVDGSTIGFDPTGHIFIPDNGVTGDKLNDDTADNTRGLEILNDMMVVKVDGVSINFNGSGELEIPTTYFTTELQNNAVTRLTSGGIETYGEVQLITTVNDTLGMFALGITATHNPASDDFLDFVFDFDETVFTTNVQSIVDLPLVYNRVESILTSGDSSIQIIPIPASNEIDLRVNLAGGIPTPASSVSSLNGSSVVGADTEYARQDHRHDVDDAALTIAKTSGLQAVLDDKIELDIAYGNFMVKSDGAYITSPGGTQFKLIVDDNGNLDTI